MGIFSSKNSSTNSKGEERRQNFVSEFLRVAGDRRLEMIASFYRSSNRLLLIPRARAVAEEIRKRRAPFQALYDFETGLARTAHPGRRWHPGAQYFYASYFKDRAEPFRTDLHNLSAGGGLNGAGLVPLIARMDYSDGRSFVLLFFEEILRPLSAGLTDALKSIEVDHHRLKDSLQIQSAVSAENRQRVLTDFEAFREKSPELTALYLQRAEADPVLASYLPDLRKAIGQSAPRTPAEQAMTTATDTENADAIAEHASPSPSAPDNPLQIAEDATTEDAIGDATADAIEDAGNPDAESAFAIAPPDSLPDQGEAGTPFEIAPEKAPEPETPFQIAEDAPSPDEEEAREFQEFLAARRAEMQDIERRLNQGLEECQREIEAIGRVADPVERVDESQAALLADDQYQHYRADLEEILADADQLFARIFALLSKLARRLTVAEMRRFVDHLIQELSQDEAILTREPHLIPRLQNYRNSLREDAPRLLNQIHAQLAEIRRAHQQDPTRALREQLEYLQARLTDSQFRSIWPTIFTIYQNLVAQEFDAHVFREIAEHLPLERQQRVLAALREGFKTGGPARAAIERKLRGAELAGIGERIHREATTGEVEELPEILERLETNHRFDPVERVRIEIREFDAGRPSPTQSQSQSLSIPPQAQDDGNAVDGESESAPDGADDGDEHSPDDARTPLDPNQESGWTIERTRALHRTQPALALEFAGRALSAGEVDAREKELLCEFIEELSESDAAMARLYIFHRSVESAGGPREQLAMIRKFQKILPPAIVQTRETNLRRAVARAPVPRLLNQALKEPEQTKRSQQLRGIVKNPHLPGGIRRALQARRDTPADAAFQNAFDSICISPHPARNKIQLLSTLGALAKARGWLTEARVRKLEDRIRLYQRITRADQTTAARYAPERRFFARNSGELIQMLRAGRPPAEILQQRDRQVYGHSAAPDDFAQAASPTTNPTTRSGTPARREAHAQAPARTSTSTSGRTNTEALAQTQTSQSASGPGSQRNRLQTPQPRPAAPRQKSGQAPGMNSQSAGVSSTKPPAVVPNQVQVHEASPTGGSLDADFMNTPIKLEHAPPETQSKSGAKAGATASAGRGGGSKPGGGRTKSAEPGFFGKLMNRVKGNDKASGSNQGDGKKETISIARLTTRAEKQFLKGDRRDPQQLLEILHTPEDLLELLHGMPEMKKNPAAKRDKAAEAIKSAIAVTVVVPKKNRVLGMPGELCFPRKDWNNELKRKNLVKSLNALAEKQLPGSEKYNYFKFLSEEIQFNYYQGKYKHGRI